MEQQDNELLRTVTDLTGRGLVLTSTNLEAHTLGSVLLMAEEYSYEELVQVIPFCLRFMQFASENGDTWFVPYFGSFCRRMKAGIHDNTDRILAIIGAVSPEDCENWSKICNDYVIRNIEEDDDGQLLVNVGEFKRMMAAAEAQLQIRGIKQGESKSDEYSDDQM